MPQCGCYGIQKPFPVECGVVFPCAQWLDQLFHVAVRVGHKFVQSQLPDSQVFGAQLVGSPGPDVVVEVCFHGNALVG